MARKYYGRRNTRTRRVAYGGKRRRNIKRWAGEKPSIMDKIARYAGPVGRIAKTVGGIMQMINPEKKFVDNNTSTAFIPTTGTAVATYTMMPQGLGDQARTGNTIKGHSIYGRYVLYLDPSATRSTVRLMWVLDKENNGSIPALSDILDNVDVVSGMNLDSSKRYAILRDTVYTMNSGNRTLIKGKFYFPTDFHVHYDGPSGAITDAKENQVFLFAISDTVGATHRS